jgi:hypothetical protein
MASLAIVHFAAAQATPDPFVDGRFHWRASAPLIDVGPGRDAADPHVAIKDPSIVFHEGRWHLFTTLRMKSGRVIMEYQNFVDWTDANAAPRNLIDLHDRYHCAPQVFYFTPHRRWYMVYQFADPERTPGMRPCFSTTENIADPHSWTKPEAMIDNAAPKTRWIDFWVICDAAKAHLFYTSNDGHMWRREARLADFPRGWSEPQLALQGDIFEASHTYKLKGRDQYLTIIEAQAPGRRYYKAYLADRLEGPWRGLADTLEKPFAARENVREGPESAWAASISHGELLRTGVDERLEVDPAHLRFLFQGVSDADYRGQKYGGIPWRLGILDLVE